MPQMESTNLLILLSTTLTEEKIFLHGGWYFGSFEHFTQNQLRLWKTNREPLEPFPSLILSSMQVIRSFTSLSPPYLSSNPPTFNSGGSNITCTHSSFRAFNFPAQANYDHDSINLKFKTLQVFNKGRHNMTRTLVDAAKHVTYCR